MPFKRSRLDSSGSFNLPESSANSSSKRTASSPSAAPPPPHNSFLRQSAAAAAKHTALVPPAADVSASSQVRLGEFLEECFFCRRSIARDSNIFMYRSCAFCREECRDRQISIDDRKGKTQDDGKPNQTAPLARPPPGMNNADGGHAAGAF